MILLADGGSTKVDWSLIHNGDLINRIFTKGANPFFRTSEEISHELNEILVPALSGFKICAVYFFGAGCATPEKNEIVKTAIEQSLGNIPTHVGSDLLGAAKSLCGNEPGIACILGTGSNSCFYDGTQIVENVSPLGYVLGDEGSGAVLGRLFLGACLKNQFSETIKQELLAQLGLTPPEILEKVYREKLPNRFLAKLTPFIKEHLHDKGVYNLVFKSFEEFFIRNVMQYDYKNNKVYFTGSIAYHFQEILTHVAETLGIKIENITQSPMYGLVEYYSQEKIENVL